MKTNRLKSTGLIVLSRINQAQVMCALVFALPVCGHAAAPSLFNFATNKSLAPPPTIQENFITVAGHEIPQPHRETIYNALDLITSPIRVSEVFRGEVRSVVREINSSYVLIDQAYELGKLKPFALKDGRSDQSIIHQLTLQRRV